MAPSCGMGPPTHLQIVNIEMFLSKGKAGTKNGTEFEGRAIQKTASPRDPFHLQTSNPGTISDAKKHLLTGAWYGCSLRGSTST